jgi:hypothetical protein
MQRGLIVTELIMVVQTTITVIVIMTIEITIITEVMIKEDNNRKSYGNDGSGTQIRKFSNKE